MVRILSKVFIYMLSFLSFASHAHGQSGPPVNPPPYVEGDIIVKLKSDDSNASASAVGARSYSSLKGQNFVQKARMQKGMRLKGSFSKMGMYHMGVKGGQTTADALQEMKNDPEVEYAEPNYIFTKANATGAIQKFSMSDVGSMAGSSSYLATGAPIQVTSTWPTINPSDVPIVAVIDTGLDTTHPIISTTGALWTNAGEIDNNGIDDDGNGYVDDIHGWNFVSNSKTMIDDDGHGTHVAGIILGVTQDIYTSPYPAAIIRIMPLKFLDGSGYGRTSDAIRAIYYAVNNGATVLNNSWGGPSYSSALHEAITYSYNAGVLFVAAAGNSGSNNDVSPMYPASYDVPNVLAVAATTDSDALAYFSNYGSNSVHLASPGVFILSSVPGGYATMSGTSMATPFVTGLAALMKAEKPTMLAYQLKQIIAANSDIITSGGHPTLQNKVSSQGRMNVYNSVQAVKTAAVDPSQPAYTFTNQDRKLASSIAASGCGLVKKMASGGGTTLGGGVGTGAPESWSLFVVLAIMALPIVLYNVLRRKQGRELRRHERFKINTDVKVSVGDRELIGSISTISVGGAQLNTDALLEQGGIITMNIRSPDGKELLQVEGRVVWSEQQKAYGVQFAETNQTIREQIMGWTTSLVKAK